ncbi:flagellar motor switch protein FliG [Paracoccus aminophilus]|uniref:Flagellar motor switch protein FliG n=1 Tax=Paracoccus aminophilus JCM 7686 TaxID=1367847 RepID=S5YRC6_PARAH|nr:FliG C-terminal domain-containing protein [Paracoccus aminophilus]AGT07821.1 flagellar motor switch protein fliG [Paracoccus aminophilus JCM 7686]
MIDGSGFGAGSFGGFDGGFDEGGFVSRVLTSRQKAAVVVRYLLAEGADLDLSALPPSAQAALAEEIASMDLIDRDTRDSVIEEFCTQIEAVGLHFPGTIDGALSLLDGHLSEATSSRLRRMAALSGASDPWQRIATLPANMLAELARTEACEIAAVMFQKLPVPRAAEVFGQLEPELARQIAYAMSLTGGIELPALRRIGLALVHAADLLPQPALEGGPVEKVGAILNFSLASTRDAVLAGLDDDDAQFAEHVRKAIFTWSNIPVRIDPRDIPRIIREIDGITLTRAMAGSGQKDQPTVEFILAALSTRLADTMREDITAMGKVSTKDTEEAMNTVVATIRRMEAAGDLFLIAGETDEDS